MSSREALEKLVRATVEYCIPFVVHVELTHRCNLRCSHCYLPAGSRPREVTTAKWIELFSKLKKWGTLFVVVSGGEPFMRNDILEILEALRARGLALRLLTNGTFIGEKQARRLAGLSPASVEISILGGTAETHDRISGVKGSFDAALKALSLLRRNGVRTMVKVPVMRANWREFGIIEKFALAGGHKLRYDICIAQRLDGDESPMNERLSSSELRRFLAARGLTGTAKDCDKDSQRRRLSLPPPEALPCGAGQNAFSIAPDGEVHPCLALRIPLGNAFSDSWDRIRRHPDLAKLRGLRFGNLEECSECELAAFCGRCAGAALLETGRIDGPSPSACKLGSILREILKPSSS